MVSQIINRERTYATATAPARRKLRVFIPYDGSKTAEATLEALRWAGLPDELEALIAVTQVWLPVSPYEITSAVSARRLKLLTSGLSSHVPALQDHEEQHVLSLEAERKLRHVFPGGLVKTEAIQDTAAMAQAILRKAKRWDAELIVLGSQISPSSKITDYAGPALKVAQDAHCSVRIARASDRKTSSALQIVIALEESSFSGEVVKVVSERTWPSGTIANLVVMQRSGPRRIDNSEHVLNTWSDILRGTGLEVLIAVEDGQPEEVLLRRSRESSVNCVFVAPHFGRTDVRDGSGLSEVTNALILGAECSVEVVRASSSNEQHLKPAA